MKFIDANQLQCNSQNRDNYLEELELALALLNK
jgi:hypothetical protein